MGNADYKTWKGLRRILKHWGVGMTTHSVVLFFGKFIIERNLKEDELMSNLSSLIKDSMELMKKENKKRLYFKHVLQGIKSKHKEFLEFNFLRLDRLKTEFSKKFKIEYQYGFRGHPYPELSSEHLFNIIYQIYQEVDFLMSEISENLPNIKESEELDDIDKMYDFLEKFIDLHFFIEEFGNKVQKVVFINWINQLEPIYKNFLLNRIKYCTNLGLTYKDFLLA